MKPHRETARTIQKSLTNSLESVEAFEVSKHAYTSCKRTSNLSNVLNSQKMNYNSDTKSIVVTDVKIAKVLSRKKNSEVI